MKQFDLKEYFANPARKVVTRDGRKVRILCTNVKSTLPIVAVITDKYRGEFSADYDSIGKYLGFKNDSCADLFFAPEKHEGWINIFKYVSTNAYLKESRIYSSKEIAEREGRGYRDYLSTIEIEWEE